MSKRQLIMVLGVWIAVLLFLGFPSGWDKILALISGLAVAILAYSMGPRQPAKPAGTVPFVEHRSTEHASGPADITSQTSQQ